MKKQTNAFCSGSLSPSEYLLRSIFKQTLLATLIMLLGIGVQAQQKVHVTGTVNDDKGNPAANASVSVRGSKTGTTTDASGAFAIDVPSSKSVIVITNTGFESQEFAVGTKTNFNVSLKISTSNLNEVVVVGYGTQKKVTLTGAVAVVKGADLAKSPATNLTNSIAGRLPGVVAVNGSGEPGYDGASIRIRGSNTLGNNDALIVIDGVPARDGGMERLNPMDIESMSVLKDASAAIYGARAANGVILITTKRGKSGKPELSFSHNQGWSAPTVLPKMTNATEYATMANEIEIYKLAPSEWAAASAAFKSTGSYTTAANSVITAPFSPDDLKKYADGSDQWGHPNTDWFKTVLKDWSTQTKENMQLTGGSENVKYLASVGYQHQDGYYKNSATGYKQYDMRINLDAKVNKYVNFQMGLVARQENRFFPTKDAGSIYRMLMRGYPTKNAIWPNGQAAPDIENGEQPVVITTNQTGYDRDTRSYFQTNGKLEITNPWVKGLKFTLNASADKFLGQGKRWVKPWYIYNWSGFEADGVTPIMTAVAKGPATQPTLNQSSGDKLSTMLEAIGSYDHSFGNHNIVLLAGVTKEKISGGGFNAFRQYFPSSAIEQLFAGGLSNQQTGGAAFERARLNYFGRVGYNYKEKYIAEFLWRYDGSYIFPQSHRFGFFPGVTAGWRISEESFFKDNVNFINSLKLRGSWGQLGNDQVYYRGQFREYDYLPLYSYGSYTAGGQVVQTLSEGVLPNPDFTWEVANNYNLGIDATLLNNKLSLEFDVFQNHRTGILWAKAGALPLTAAYTPPPANIGKVDNKGWEAKVSYNNSIGELRYNVGINGGYAANKIIEWSETPGRPAYQQSTGHIMPTNSTSEDAMLYYQYDGVFKDQKEIDANTLDYGGVGGAGKLFPGSMKFKDVNGDGKIDGLDRVRSNKNQIPKFQGGLTIGLNYKNFDLNILFQAATGAELFIQTETGTIGNFLKDTYDHRWTLDNPSSVYPRTVDRNNQYFSNRNSFYTLSTNYIRLKNFEFGYTLPSSIGKKLGITRLRAYVNGLNMVTWSKEKIYDPESQSSDGHYYPQSKVINTGINLTF
ncbi:TonB-dependent receptor [soil metagenome]|jgi:TonB-linked SusC/RagA family outer membrane protein